MYSHVTAELPALVNGHVPADPARSGIFGHSMGGHGALVCAFRNPQQYRSVSAFAPIVAPSQVPWGRSEEHTSELQSLMRISYVVFCSKKTLIYHDDRVELELGRE